MFQGFYNLASGVLQQTRNLNVISNNMVNITTPGFRSDTYIETTFRDVMMYRTGNTDKSGNTPIGEMNRIVAGAGNVTNYKQGALTQTASSLDFALTTDGFFAIQSGGQTVYTRNGSFCLDDEGYLYLDGAGRVLGTDGPIYLGTDKLGSDGMGGLYDSDTGQFLGRIRVVDFNNYDTDLEKTTGDLFVAAGNGQDVNASMMQYCLEDSNVDVIQEYTQMMSIERSLQSAAQLQKMYDQLAAKIVQIGPT